LGKLSRRQRFLQRLGNLFLANHVREAGRPVFARRNNEIFHEIKIQNAHPNPKLPRNKF
jgi:hypothetical protein